MLEADREAREHVAPAHQRLRAGGLDFGSPLRDQWRLFEVLALRLAGVIGIGRHDNRNPALEARQQGRGFQLRARLVERTPQRRHLGKDIAVACVRNGDVGRGGDPLPLPAPHVLHQA